MSWFFGKKKQYKDSPPDTPSNEPSSSNQTDDYIFVEKRSSIYPSNIEDAGANSNNAVYPQLPNVTPYPPSVTQNISKQSQTDFSNLINAIPFKLCTELEKTLNNDLDIDTIRINEISYFIERVQNASNEYDFNVENSVISEMNSQTEE